MKKAIFCLILLASTARAGQVNGIRFADYDVDKMKLVTVRYRKDNGEMRWVYANMKAYLALVDGTTDYPDGSVFGKRAVATEPDPYFASSAVPSGTVRYQLMVRDRKKYASTDGWGYAIFDSNGVPAINEKDIALACYQCHTRARDIGEVFSQPMGREIKNKLSDVVFDVAARESLPPSLARHVAGASALLLRGAEHNHAFAGTFSEFVPLLAARSKRTGQVVAFVAADGKWAAAWTDPNGGDCQEGGVTGTWTLTSTGDAVKDSGTRKFCQTEAR